MHQLHSDGPGFSGMCCSAHRLLGLPGCAVLRRPGSGKVCGCGGALALGKTAGVYPIFVGVLASAIKDAESNSKQKNVIRFIMFNILLFVLINFQARCYILQ